MNSIESKACQGKDVFERMNYLYQASRFIATSSEVAASHYGNILISCAKKAVLRMEPAIKRTICKSCRSPLIPGETARIRLVSKPVKAVKTTCLICNTPRRIPYAKSYKLWSDQPESLVQMYDYTPKKSEPLLVASVKTDAIEDEKTSTATETNIPQEQTQQIVASERSNAPSIEVSSS